MPWLAKCDFCKEMSEVVYPDSILMIMQMQGNKENSVYKANIPFPLDYLGSTADIEGWYGHFSVGLLRYEFCCPSCAQRGKELVDLEKDVWLAKGDSDGLSRAV